MPFVCMWNEIIQPYDFEMLDLIISSIKSCKNWLHVIFEYGHKLGVGVPCVLLRIKKIGIEINLPCV